MPSLKSQYLESISFTASQASVLRLLGEYRGKQTLFERQKPEVLKSMRDLAVIESSESSNRLEGIEVPHARIKDLMRSDTAPRNRSEQEVAGYRDALALIHDARSDMPFSVNVIRQLHKTIYGYHATPGGDWKMTSNEIIERGIDGSLRVRFKPVSPVSVAPFMDDLIENYEAAVSTSGQDPLVLLPLAILDFLCIHPFSDGNGRVGRLVTLLLSYHHGYEVGRYISLERVIEDSKETYYEALETSSQGWHEDEHDVHPWLDYFWGLLLKAYSEFEERAGSPPSGRGSKTDRVRRAVMRQIAAFTIADLEKECPGVSRETIRNVLRDFRDSGVVAATGTGRGAKWKLL